MILLRKYICDTFNYNLFLFLDVLIAALTDTLNERAEMTSNQEVKQIQSYNPESQGLLQQILQLSSADKAAIRSALKPYIEQTRNDPTTRLHGQNENALQHLSLDIAKYKNH